MSPRPFAPRPFAWPLLAALLAAVAAVLFTGAASRQAEAQDAADYLDAALSPEQRADDLLARLSLREKVGQMTQINATSLQGNASDPWDRGSLNPDVLRVVLKDNQAGSILSGGGASPAVNSPRAWAEMTNAIQAYAIANQIHHIPIIYGIDAVHGHNNVLGATMFPHQFGLGAAYDTKLTRQLARATAADVRATGIHWNFAPVADIWRDLRWGRSYEPFSEAPLAAGDQVAANVQGLQGHDLRSSGSVAATVKHFIGYSAPDTGKDRTNATISERELREAHLPPFIRGIDAGGETVMANSGSVNGVPVHASHELLTDLLRDRLGFDGVLVSDWEDILKLQTVHGVAATYEDAIVMAINAGIDMSMVPIDATGFTSRLIALVEAGRVSQARIDEAVHRILTLKFRLGLFERSYADVDRAEDIAGAHGQLARKAAAETLTLLENDGTLPLERGGTNLLVTGPSADSMVNQLGGWSIGWQGATVPGELPEGVTVREGIEHAVGAGARVRYAPGVPGGEDAEDPQKQADARAAAVRAAQASDVVVAVVGEPPYAEGEGDTDTAALPPGQAELLDALQATGKPVVVVVIAGRPLIMNAQLDGAAAALMAYLPGTQGGQAVADALFGRVNPSGRLSITWPKSVAQAPLTHDRLPGEPYDPRYPFGHGLSYTRFEYGHLDARTRGHDVKATLGVANKGKRAGKHTVLLFANERLVAYRKLWLEPGDRRRVSLEFELDPGRYVLEAGEEVTTVRIR
jgi:beta-glucosidase